MDIITTQHFVDTLSPVAVDLQQLRREVGGETGVRCYLCKREWKNFMRK